jgi:ParB family transcriptional regulator, chromosome partitioning protein
MSETENINNVLQRNSMKNAKRSTGLGRGLSALLGENDYGASPAPLDNVPEYKGLTKNIDIALLAPDTQQPRRHFDESALEELAKSIADRGVLQPIIARETARGLRIVAGERRWRAAQKAGLHQIPVIIKSLNDGEALEIGLLENIQRKDLNAIEEAESYRRLIAEFGYTQEELGNVVHKSRSHVANLLRLLDLPSSVSNAVIDGKLSMGHARALLTSADPDGLMKFIIDQNLSVRETEVLVKAQGLDKKTASGEKQPKVKDVDIQTLELSLSESLGVKVKIQDAKGAGKISISYLSLDQLDMICARLS